MWLWWPSRFCVFFFQAEDGIRDPLVTGVQTCALPISSVQDSRFRRRSGQRSLRGFRSLARGGLRQLLGVVVFNDAGNVESRLAIGRHAVIFLDGFRPGIVSSQRFDQVEMKARQHLM